MVSSKAVCRLAYVIPSGPQLKADDHTSGHATVDIERDEVLVDNGDAFSIHNLTTGSCVAVFSTGRPKHRYPKHAVFGEGGDAVIVGSDHGNAYIFERAGGHPLDVLHHADRGCTQTVAVRRYIFHDFTARMLIGCPDACHRVREYHRVREFGRKSTVVHFHLDSQTEEDACSNSDPGAA